MMSRFSYYEFKNTAYYHVLHYRISMFNPRVVYNVELDILADLTLELREDPEPKGELFSCTQPLIVPTCICNYSDSILSIHTEVVDRTVYIIW